MTQNNTKSDVYRKVEIGDLLFASHQALQVTKLPRQTHSTVLELKGIYKEKDSISIYYQMPKTLALNINVEMEEENFEI